MRYLVGWLVLTASCIPSDLELDAATQKREAYYDTEMKRCALVEVRNCQTTCTSQGLLVVSWSYDMAIGERGENSPGACICGASK